MDRTHEVLQPDIQKTTVDEYQGKRALSLHGTKAERDDWGFPDTGDNGPEA